MLHSTLNKTILVITTALTLHSASITTMEIKRNSRLYLYEKPYQQAKRVKMYNPAGSRIVIYGCDKYSWCKVDGGYVKEFWLKNRRVEETTSSEKIQESKKVEPKVETKPAPITIDESKRSEVKVEVVKKEKAKKEKKHEKTKESVVKETPIIVSTATPQKTELPKETITPQSSSAQKSKIFFGIEATYTMMNVTKKDKVGTISLAKSPSESGYGLNAEIGYNYMSDIFFTAALRYQHYDDVNLYNSLVSINKRFIYNDIRPYVGIVGGLSTIELIQAHTALPLDDTLGNQIALGLQIGVEYMLVNDLLLVGEYQLLKAEHTTTISSSPAKIELIRDYYSTFSFGVRW